MAIVGFAGIIAGGVLAGLGGKVGQAALPVSWFYILIVIAAAMMLISLLGITSIKRTWRYGTCFFLFLTIILLIGIIFVMTTLILYANQSAGALQGTVQGIQTEFETFLTGYAIKSPEEWKNTQQALDCCGVNMKTLYEIPTGGTVDTILTGEKCTVQAVAVIKSIIAQYPTYNETVQAVADANPLIGDDSDGFFCMQNIILTSRKYTAAAGAISGVLAFIQFVSIVLVFVLFCNVREEEGGFAVLDGEESIPLKSAAAGTGNDIPEPNSGTGGGVFLKPGGAGDGFVGQAQQFAGRMSMRMGFTPHTPHTPRGPPAGFGGPPPSFGQLSTDTPLVSNGFGRIAPEPSPSTGGFGGGGDGLPAPNSGLPQPNAGFGGARPPPPPSFGFGAVKDFGSRMSMNLKQAFGRPPPPFGGPPPSFGGGIGGAPPPMPNLGGGSRPPPPAAAAPPMPNLGGPPMPSLGGPPSRGPPMPNFGGGAPARPPPPSAPISAPAPAPSGGGGGGGSGAKNDPKYKKYVMMEKCNLPEGAIRQKMNLDGLSQAEQDAFFR